MQEAAVVGNAISGADGLDSTCPLELTTFVPALESIPASSRLDGITVGVPAGVSSITLVYCTR